MTISETMKKTKKGLVDCECEKNKSCYRCAVYCEDCGKKNVFIPTGMYDPDSGKPLLKARCYNNNCEVGSKYIRKIECQQNGHTFITVWLLIIPDYKKCINCGFVKEYGSISDSP